MRLTTRSDGARSHSRGAEPPGSAPRPFDPADENLGSVPVVPPDRHGAGAQSQRQPGQHADQSYW
jgi:hypothetical protein